MATTNNLAALDGNFKAVYGDSLIDLLPSSLKLLREIEFVTADKEQGGKYNQPVIVAHEHGVTFAGPNTDDAFALNNAVAGQVKNATVDAVEMVLVSQISLKALSRAETSQNAFVNATKHVVGNMNNSISKKLETLLFYGGTGLAKVASVAGDNVITIAAADWAPGIWTGAEGMFIQAYAGETLQNTGGVTGWSNASNPGKAMQITAVNIAARTITVETGHAAGVLANAVLYFAGSKGNELEGLKKIMSNTGTLFGIDAAKYGMWAGNTFPVGGKLTFSKILAAVELAGNKGLEEDVDLFINPGAFAGVLADIEAARVYDSSYSNKRIEAGAKELVAHTHTGHIRIIPSPYVKEGDAFMIVLKDFLRVGSTDVTFKRPGSSESFFKDMEKAAGVELRCYTDQTLFCERPSRQVLLTGIVN